VRFLSLVVNSENKKKKIITFKGASAQTFLAEVVGEFVPPCTGITGFEQNCTYFVNDTSAGILWGSPANPLARSGCDLLSFFITKKKKKKGCKR